MDDTGLIPLTLEEVGEPALLSGLRAQDGRAFEQLVRIYCMRLLAVARRVLRNEEDAREALQDAFLSAFKGIGGFDGRSPLSTWLHRIVLNCALMKLRRRVCRPELPIDPLLPGFLEDGHQAEPAAPWRDTGPNAVEREETCRLVRNGIENLPESYRTVLVLRDIEGLDTEETASLLGVSTGVVKTRLHRARQALRTLLDPYFREGAP
jgi:RNA polymerase sigma-70 factor (ECF subfamily)